MWKLDSAGPGLTAVASSCERGNAGSGSVKEIPYHLATISFSTALLHGINPLLLPHPTVYIVGLIQRC